MIGLGLVLLVVSYVSGDPKAAGGYGAPPPGPGYGYGAPAAYFAPIYAYDQGGSQYGGGFKKLVKDFKHGIKHLAYGDPHPVGGPALVGLYQQGHAPHYEHPIPEPQIVEVQVPKCEPLTHYITNFITETVPVPIVNTEFVENVVPTILHQTHFQRQLETEFVTDVLVQNRISTLTRSVAVPRTQFVTQTFTDVRTNNIFQRTTEVMFTPVFRTRAVTVTQTVTQTENIPRLDIRTDFQTRFVPTTAYVTETKIQLQPSLVLETVKEFVTLTETQFVPKLTTKYGPPRIFTTTEFNHVTTSIYEAAKAPAVAIDPITVTQQVKEYVPTITTFNQYITTTVVQQHVITETAYRTQYVTKTEYQQTTHVRTDYVTVQAQCGGGIAAAGYGSGEPSFPLTPALQPVAQQAGYGTGEPSLPLTPALQPIPQQASFVAAGPQFAAPQVVATPQLPAPQFAVVRQPVVQNVAAPTFQEVGVSLSQTQPQALGGGGPAFGGGPGPALGPAAGPGPALGGGPAFGSGPALGGGGGFGGVPLPNAAVLSAGGGNPGLGLALSGDDNALGLGASEETDIFNLRNGLAASRLNAGTSPARPPPFGVRLSR